MILGNTLRIRTNHMVQGMKTLCLEMGETLLKSWCMSNKKFDLKCTHDSTHPFSSTAMSLTFDNRITYPQYQMQRPSGQMHCSSFACPWTSDQFWIGQFLPQFLLCYKWSMLDKTKFWNKNLSASLCHWSIAVLRC